MTTKYYKLRKGACRSIREERREFWRELAWYAGTTITVMAIVFAMFYVIFFLTH